MSCRVLQAALTVISRMLRLHSQAFGFAGTKDRRGVTTQYVTLFKVDPSKLSGLNQRCDSCEVFVWWSALQPRTHESKYCSNTREAT